uniref:Calcium/calmodulin-dependent 3',5'-cyclic nucleotide phosphodiesterase 1C n=1 Tax=Echinostoma caproni TaxID=27848 RepID=A0A183BAF4_9TREM
LKKLREALIGNTGGTASSAPSTNNNTQAPPPEKNTDKQDSWLNRLTDGAKRVYETARRTVGGRRAIDTTPGFLLSRIRAASLQNETPSPKKVNDLDEPDRVSEK